MRVHKSPRESTPLGMKVGDVPCRSRESKFQEGKIEKLDFSRSSGLTSIPLSLEGNRTHQNAQLRVHLHGSYNLVARQIYELTDRKG